MKKLALHWKILIALILGVVLGIWLPEYVKYVSWMGDLFMRALKMVIIPLILTSIISGIVNIGSLEKLGKIGLKTISYYLTTSVLAIVTGLFIVNLLKPGVGADLGFVSEVEGLALAKESFGQTLINIIPTNVVQAMAENQMLSVIFFAVLVGFFITNISKKHKKLYTKIFNGGFELMMKITEFVIKFTPYGVFGIVAFQVSQQKDLMEVAGRLGLYMVAVILALIIHSCITLPLILKFIGKINPFSHIRAMSTPLLTAFSTSSSSATLPLTMEAVEHKAGASNKITSFVLPLGATINMDGTALYECIAAIFIAQAYGIDLSFGEQIVVVITALLASIGAAGIPMAGLVMITVILSAVNLPLEGVGLILAVDRILDMFRTAVNVWSDSCGTVIIAKSEGEHLNYNHTNEIV
jgi:proton glutamate symport protein